MSNEESNETPKLLSDRIDARALTVNIFYDAIETLKSGKIEGVSMGQDTQLVIYTTFGTVTGQLMEDEYENDAQLNSAAMIHEIFMKVRNKQLISLEEEGVNRLVNDSGYIPIVNAQITPFGNPNNVHRLGYFLLYPDQITGLTFGQYQQD
ncbi:hypothetical protein H9649_07420 [Sporosarcina sp. Sa2YVA2]|uniref:Uncharacterized protein n=1 Tax=Sporosarcina quadrami TaxID=2762234 RepID=A0ABR8U9L6_9BACL|nr:hypothetical protein [Sporosarcina quadrami]MBD7984403.1 hypothetical protein [Sporosarcina quadrami]